MTQTTRPRRRSLLALMLTIAALGIAAAVLLTLAILAVVQPVNDGVQAQTPAGITMTRIDAIPAVQAGDLPFAALEGTDALTTAQLAEVQATADRICEGLQAEVPVMVLADALAAEQGLTDEAARAFVNEAAVNHCR